MNFALTTSIGAVDLLGEIAGGGSYEQLEKSSISIGIYGFTIRCLSLSKLIETKRAAGRPKDFETITELEILRDDHGKGAA